MKPALTESEYEAILDRIANIDREKMFCDIYAYSPYSALRYANLICFGREVDHQRDREEILAVLPTNRKKALGIAEIRRKLSRLNPHYELSGLARNLNHLVSQGEISKRLCKTDQFHKTINIYWKNNDSSIQSL